jgi:hypothetical protein
LAEFDAHDDYVMSQRHVSKNLFQPFAQLGDLFLAAFKKRDGLTIGLCDVHGRPSDASG